MLNTPDYKRDDFPQSACSMFPSKDSRDFSVVHHPNAYLKYLYMTNHPYQWGVGTLGRSMAHELGHSLGLAHKTTCDNIMHGKGTKGRKFLDDRQVEYARYKINNTNLIRYLDR